MEWGFLACFCRFVIRQTSGLVFWADMAEDHSFKKGNILHTAQAQYKNVLIGPLGPSLYSCRGAGQLFSCGSFIQCFNVKCTVYHNIHIYEKYDHV